MRRGQSAALLALIVGACAAPEPPAAPPPPPPPPPPVVQELAPPDAYYFYFDLPERTESGAYLTPNTQPDVGPLEQLFHYRSALNVAALSCRHLEGYDLAPAYNSFIKSFAGPLGNANRAIEQKFVREHGGDGARVRDAHMTSLYNHFARPATLGEFCPAAQQHLTAMQTLPEGELQGYAETALADMEEIFQEHFAVIEEYQEGYREQMRERGLSVPPGTEAAVAAPST